MNLGSCIKLMVFATMTALIYTHMQMQIVDLAYKGKDKERKMHDLIDNNGVLRHQILVMKSANNLGQKLLDKDEGLEFMGQTQVMTMSAPASVMPPVERPKARVEAPFWNLLSFLSPQEARAWDH